MRSGAFSHTNRHEAVVCFQSIVDVAVHYFFVYVFASLQVGRGLIWEAAMMIFDVTLPPPSLGV